MKIYTKIKKNMTLTEHEHETKSKPRVLAKLERSIAQFIAGMQLPIYDQFSYFNFHDCLAAFAKSVFSAAHRQQYEEREKRIQDAIVAGNHHELRLIDRI